MADYERRAPERIQCLIYQKGRDKSTQLSPTIHVIVVPSRVHARVYYPLLGNSVYSLSPDRRRRKMGKENDERESPILLRKEKTTKQPTDHFWYSIKYGLSLLLLRTR